MRFAFCLLLLLAGEACHVAACAENAKNQIILASESYCLSKSEVAKYTAEAMAGSRDSANKLVNFYWMCIAARSPKKAERWALIGAENGDVESQFRAYQTLSTSANRLDQQRALFWLNKAAEQNYLGARAILRNCPNISVQRPNGHPCFGPGSDQCPGWGCSQRRPWMAVNEVSFASAVHDAEHRSRSRGKGAHVRAQGGASSRRRASGEKRRVVSATGSCRNRHARAQWLW